MNAVSIRRRWLTVRPWLSDLACAAGMILLCVLAFAALDIAASYGQHIGLLAGEP